MFFSPDQPRYVGANRNAVAPESNGLLSLFGQESPRYLGADSSSSDTQTVSLPVEFQNPGIRPDPATPPSFLVKGSPSSIAVPANARRYRATASLIYSGNRLNPAPLSAILVGFDEPAESLITAGQPAIQLTPTWVALAAIPVEAGALRCLVTVEFS